MNPYDDLKDRIGKFCIPYGYINDRPQDVLKIMAKMIILRAECKHYAHCYEYIALSLLFDVVPEGMEPPFYEVLFWRENDGSLTPNVEKSSFQDTPKEPKKINFKEFL